MVIDGFLEAGVDEIVIEPKGSDIRIFRQLSRTSSSTKIPFWKPYQITRKAAGDGTIQGHPSNQTRIVFSSATTIGSAIKATIYYLDVKQILS